MRSIDGKYGVTQGDSRGKIINLSTGVEIPVDEPLFLIRGKDLLAVEAVLNYRNLASQHSVASEFLTHLDEVISGISDFQRSNPERCKFPD